MSTIRLTFEIVAINQEEERLQRLWLRYMERSGLLGAHMQAAFQCEACSLAGWEMAELEAATEGEIKTADLCALYELKVQP